MTDSFPAERILVGVTGSVAAMHMPAIVSAMRALWSVEITVVMTRAAEQFVTPKALAICSRRPVARDADRPSAEPGVDHIELTRWADLMLVMPATADLIGKVANGLAPDLLTTCVLAATVPVALAPSMNEAMWAKPAVQRNAARLRADGYGVIPPATGVAAADGAVADGAMAPLPVAEAWLRRWLAPRSAGAIHAV
jgi:phosphopantothenoylcysteine decarboxylase/phosphopantothenate--cysteine ligase